MKKGYVVCYHNGDHMVYLNSCKRPSIDGSYFEDELNKDVSVFDTFDEAERRVGEANYKYYQETDWDMEEDGDSFVVGEIFICNDEDKEKVLFI